MCCQQIYFIIDQSNDWAGIHSKQLKGPLFTQKWVQNGQIFEGFWFFFWRGGSEESSILPPPNFKKKKKKKKRNTGYWPATDTDFTLLILWYTIYQVIRIQNVFMICTVTPNRNSILLFSTITMNFVFSSLQLPSTHKLWLKKGKKCFAHWLDFEKWATPFEFDTPPVEDLRNILHRGSVNSK